MSLTRVQTFCQNCHMKCRIFCDIKENRIAGIRNAMGIPGEKAKACVELLYHPKRLLYPLKRTGERGQGKWKRISWNEALEIMAKKFFDIKNNYGPEALATVMGCGHKAMAPEATRLFSYVTGTPNILNINQQCTYPLGVAELVTFGDRVCADFGPHFRYSQCILIWGSNPRHNRPPLDRDINRAQVKGAKVIKVDPRPPETIDLKNQGLPAADIWLRLRPGTDAALALGMIKIIIDECLYNKEFVKKWCFGFDELKKHIKGYTIDEVADITWVPKEKIVKAAKLFATSKASCLHARLGVGSQQFNATQSSRAVCILAALAADIDMQGGNLLPDRDVGREARPVLPIFPPEVEKRRLGAREYPLLAGSKDEVHDFNPYGFAHNQPCFDAMLRGEIKALYIPGSNIVVSEGDSHKTADALRNLDFLTVVDHFMTPTAELADIVLPAAHFLETEIPLRAYQSMGREYMNYILAPRKVVKPSGECWDDRKIVIELAKKMGIDIPWPDVASLNDWQVEEFGLKYDDIINAQGQMISWPLKYKKYEKANFRFKTPSGKIELYSSILGNHGYAPLPSYFEPPESPISTPELYEEYPLILTNHRSIVYMHSEFRQIPSLRKMLPDPTIEINSGTAAKLGIREGDEVYIERPGFTNRIIMNAKLSPELHPNVVSCIPLWWFPEKMAPEYGCFESNINSIISTNPPYDPVSMNYQMRALLCRVGRNESSQK